MGLKALNKPVKGTLNWDEPINENFKSIEEYAAEVDTKLGSVATASANGLMSSADKDKLDKIAAAATANAPSGTTPKAAGTAAVGTETGFARGDHVHPSQTTVTGNAGTATKLAATKTFELTGDVTGTVSSDLSGNVSIAATQVANKSNQKVAVSKNSATAAGTRKQINFKEGSNVTITVADNATNDAVDVTIAAADTTYSAATTSAAGLMSSADKTKLDGITEGANAVSPSATIPKGNGTAAVGSETAYARGDHVHPSQTTVSGNAGTATTLQTARTIDGVDFNGSAAIGHYAECTIAAATAAKTASITGFKLVAGARATIKFTITNTAAAPTLNITGTGAKDMMYRGVKITDAAPTLQANGVYDFVYNGTAFEIVGSFGGGYGC